MQFLLAFRYVFDRTGGFVNLLLITVCEFIPVIGPIVLLGYRAEVSIALEYDPDLRRHPKFDFNRFGEYLKRGVWPFLIGLVLTLPIFPLVFGIIIVGLVVNPPGPNNPPFLFIAIFLVALLVPVLVSVLSVPMMFHAEIAGKFDFGGAFRFAVAFWKLVGFVAIGTAFVFAFLSFFVSILGFLCCFVGIYPAQAIIQMASQHLLVQLYRIYLNRGGEPIPEYEPPEPEDDIEDDEEDDRDEW